MLLHQQNYFCQVIQAVGQLGFTICAGGSLGTIIPPSVVAVVMGPLANLSVGDILYGMTFPGLLMGLLYLIYIFVLCILRPENGPAIPRSPDDPSFGEKLAIRILDKSTANLDVNVLGFEEKPLVL